MDILKANSLIASATMGVWKNWQYGDKLLFASYEAGGNHRPVIKKARRIAGFWDFWNRMIFSESSFTFLDVLN